MGAMKHTTDEFQKICIVDGGRYGRHAIQLNCSF